MHRVDVRFDELIDGLERAGLSGEEASVFVHLLRLGEARASEVATATGLDRSKAYRLLGALGERGFVDHSLGRPRKYWAQEPGTVFDELLRVRRAQVDELRETREEIEGALQRLAETAEGGLQRPTYRVLQGRPAIHQQGLQMLREAQASILGLTTHQVGLNLAEATGTLGLALERAREADVAMRVIFGEGAGVREALSRVDVPETAELRTVEMERTIRFILVDEQRLVVWGTSEATSRLRVPVEVGITTDAPTMVAAYLELFERVWDDGDRVP